MKRTFLVLSTLLLIVGCAATNNQTPAITVDAALPEAEEYAFIIADAGRNGSYDQTRIGEVMGLYADKCEPEYVLNCGDMFHYNGVQSINDPLWISNFESIYPHGELQVPWWGVLGNHEYHGNTQAVIDYTNVSRRWNVPSRYYSQTFEGANEADSVFVLFTDTAPMIDKYHIEPDYPDAKEQDPTEQIKWIDSTLAKTTAKWKIAIGHHPIYSYSKKDPAEGEQMRNRVAKLYNKYDVDLSFSGHVHIFQHLQPKGEATDYFVCPSASLGRNPQTGEHTKFATKGTGFIILGFNDDNITVSMIGNDGKMVYSYAVTK